MVSNSNAWRSNLKYEFIKRCFDLISSLIAVICLMPLYIILAVMVKADSKGSVIFTHERLGKYGKKIKVYKYRTMVPNAEHILSHMPLEIKNKFQENFKIENDPRITRLGRFLREYSLDELPQLINIIKGEMSIVGPRPIIEKELEKYGNFGEKLLSVNPGLTGYWQVNGRSDTSYEERVKLDMYYIEKRNLYMDILIILKTIKVVCRKVGAK